MATLTGRRGLVIAVSGCVLAAALGLVAAGRGWVSFTVAEPPLPSLRKTASGHAVAGAVMPLALVVLAGVVVLPATRKLGRRLAGAVIALAGIVLVVEAIDVLASPRQAVAAEAVKLTGNTGARAASATAAGWPWLVVVAGVLAVAVGVLTVGWSRGWPAMGRRYDASGSAGRDKAAEASMWERFDRGDDPTI